MSAQSSGIGRKMARGAALMVAWRLIERVLGLVTTLVLARVLVPEDFGLVAMAMSIIAMLELLGEFGFDMALIQNQRAARHHYDTAWTIGACYAVVSSLALVAIAAPASRFYNEPRLEAVCYCLAIGVFLRGFVNIGTVAFRKELQLEKEVKFQAARKLIVVGVTIALALKFHSYWALAVAYVVSHLIGLVISYLMHPFRPWFSLAGWRDLFHFSKWMLVTNILSFLQNRSVDFIIGKIAGARSLGVYNVAYEISNLPTTELVAPVTRATFPGYAKISEDPNALRQIFLKVTGVIAIAVVPAGAGISAMAELVVKLALGPKWLEAIPLMSVLAFYGVIQAVLSNMSAMLIALGRVRLMVVILAINVTLLLPALLIGARESGALGAATGTLLATIAMIPINVTLVLRSVDIPFRELWQTVWRPFAAAAIMYGLVDMMMRAWQVDTYIGMVQKSVVIAVAGAVVYALTVLLLWRLASCPDSAEEYLLRKFHLEKLMATCKLGLH